MRIFLVLIAALCLQGCVASVAKTIVTAPFKIAGATVDALTTSRDEADLKRGRDIRKAEERQKMADKKARKQAQKQADKDAQASEY
jgi:hypothetical protein